MSEKTTERKPPNELYDRTIIKPINMFKTSDPEKINCKKSPMLMTQVIGRTLNKLKIAAKYADFVPNILPIKFGSVTAWQLEIFPTRKNAKTRQDKYQNKPCVTKLKIPCSKAILVTPKMPPYQVATKVAMNIGSVNLLPIIK